MESRRRPGFPKRYKAVEYNIWPSQDAQIHSLAKNHEIAMNEVVRRMFAHALTCPLFDVTSIDTTIAPEPK